MNAWPASSSSSSSSSAKWWAKHHEIRSDPTVQASKKRSKSKSRTSTKTKPHKTKKTKVKPKKRVKSEPTVKQESGIPSSSGPPPHKYTVQGPNYSKGWMSSSSYDPAFVEINLPQVTEAVGYFDEHPLIMLCERIRLQHLTSGGVVITRQGKVMDEHARRFFDNVYVGFVTRLVKTWSRYGFAVAQIRKDKVYLGEPQILEMSMLRIRMKVTYTGDRTYKVFRHERGDFHYQDEELKDVHIFEYEPPSVNGDCRSELLRLVADLQHYDYLRVTHLQAAHNAANPLVFLQQREPKLDDITPTMGGSIQHAPITSSGTTTGRPMMPSFRQAAMAYAMATSRNTGIPLPEDKQLTEIPGHTQETWKLDMNQEVGHHVPIQDYTNWEDARVALEERIAGVMGVPRQLFAVSGYTHNVERQQTTQEFHDHQDSLKREVVRVLYEMYNYIYQELHVNEAMEEMKTSDIISQLSTVKRQAMVHIDLPGVPDKETMTELFQQGIIEYEYFKSYLSHSYMIPIEAFCAKPKLTLQELNGIKPEAATASKPKPKAKSKAKK